ncbi:MAG: D-alanyl-D-alanine carboxypeptidase family protein [Patescibacteria group bacterium]|jgi:D-alanyl-D-alanine carboxypeptidase
MSSFALLLVVLRFFTGALDTAQQQLLGVFDIFSGNQTVADFAQSLNYLIGPIRNLSYADLALDTKAAIITDVHSGRILYSKNSTTQLPIASLTKIMTALVVLDQHGDQLNTVISVPAEAVNVTGSKMSLYANEKITIHNLLKGMLIESANDAATALAYTINGNPKDFVASMNQKAGSLGLIGTHFTNPVGFDDDQHYSTAEDVVKLASAAMDNKVFADIVATPKATVRDVTGKFVHQLITTNKLLSQYKNVIGIKTGTTDEAGESLVAAVSGDSGQTVIVVLLDSPNRFQEGKKALDWALKAYSWIEPL